MLAVVGIGCIQLEPKGKPEHVLHVHKLFASIVLVHHVASKASNTIEFDGTTAFLCNKVVGWKIGLAKVQKGLYHLPSTLSKEQQIRGSIRPVAGVVSKPKNEEDNTSPPQIRTFLFFNSQNNACFDKPISNDCELAKHKSHSYNLNMLKG